MFFAFFALKRGSDSASGLGLRVFFVNFVFFCLEKEPSSITELQSACDVEVAAADDGHGTRFR